MLAGGLDFGEHVRMSARLLEAWPDGALSAALYRRLRLAWGGLDDLAWLLPPRGLVVDLGCGEGLLAHLWVRGGTDRRVVAVDWDPDRVARLRSSLDGLPIEAALDSMETFEIPACDGVALVDVLHYLDATAQDRLLDRAATALRPGGTVVLRDPDAGAGWHHRLARAHEHVFQTLGITRGAKGRFRTGAEWARALEARGLEARVLPASRVYADRTLVGHRPSSNGRARAPRGPGPAAR